MNRYKVFNRIYSCYQLLGFWLLKTFISFSAANQYIQRVDKKALQIILKMNGAVIGQNCDIETGIIFHNCKDYRNLSIGDNCHIGKDCFFDLRDKICIGTNVTISMQCTLITHQDTGRSTLSFNYPISKSPIIINDNAYLGVRSIFLQGVNVGHSTIIAAGSIVKYDIPDRTLAGGAPARIIKVL
jgi:acetyltransferase-like isoleucine patch superfamily enzyme